MTATLDWYGCATFRLTIGSLVVFLDAYIDRVDGAPGPGLVADDIDRCDFIVVGHSHFDHLWGAERIARRTGAKIIGSYETVRVMQTQGIPLDQLIAVAGGERIRLAPEVLVSVFPSLHSCVWSHRAMPSPGEVCIGDLGLTYAERQERMAELYSWFASFGSEAIEHLRISNQDARGDGGALLYAFDTPEGQLLYQDTSGYWTGMASGLHPDVAIIAAAGRGNIDGEPIQGSLAQFVAREASLLRPKRVILSHHDDWLPGFSTPTDIEPIRKELARFAPSVTLDELGYLDSHPVFTSR
ncbi:MAG TPA: MBL fold metallo-hydrolase [Streptosporangiaceae bacterium]|nr:MBL fold metallo-hydrolase [Streptosporangiaceae bacterium]